MKKKITIAFVLLMVAVLTVTAFAFTGCKGKDDGKLKIVVTIFPEYDWVMNVLGDRASDVSVTLLLDSGADLHSYNPSVADIVAVAQADLFIYVGGESDKWVDDALKNAKNKNMRTMNLLELLGDKAYEEAINNLTKEDITSLMQEILAQGNFMEVVMKPAKTAEAE